MKQNTDNPKLLTVDYSLGSLSRRTELYQDEKMIGYLLACANQLLSYYAEWMQTNVPKTLTLKFKFSESQLPPAEHVFVDFSEEEK